MRIAPLLLVLGCAGPLGGCVVSIWTDEPPGTYEQRAAGEVRVEFREGKAPLELVGAQVEVGSFEVHRVLGSLEPLAATVWRSSDFKDFEMYATRNDTFVEPDMSTGPVTYRFIYRPGRTDDYYNAGATGSHDPADSAVYDNFVVLSAADLGTADIRVTRFNSNSPADCDPHIGMLKGGSFRIFQEHFAGGPVAWVWDPGTCSEQWLLRVSANGARSFRRPNQLVPLVIQYQWYTNAHPDYDSFLAWAVSEKGPDALVVHGANVIPR